MGAKSALTGVMARPSNRLGVFSATRGVMARPRKPSGGGGRGPGDEVRPGEARRAGRSDDPAGEVDHVRGG